MTNRIMMDTVHDFIDAERNGTKFKSACGREWVRAERIDEQQRAKLDVNCERCLEIRAYYEGMAIGDEAS